MRLQKHSAFTLIELLVVISIIALLSSVVLASLNSARTKGKLGAGKYASAQVDHIAGDYPVALWDFDECSGTSVADRSGNGYNGVIPSGGPSFSTNTPTGKGCSLSFDGVDDYMDSSYPNLPQSTWTISAWVYDTKSGGNGYRAIVQVNTNSDDALYIYPGNYLGFWPCGANPASASFPSNEWVFVTATFDSTTGFKYYLNGAQVGTSATCPDGSDWQFLHVGGINSGDPERWQGYIDNVHIYAKTLTASDVGRLYAEERRSADSLAKMK